MRKKDEEVIEKVVNRIIDSKVLLTGDGDFYVETFNGEISSINIRNLFSKESNINEISISFGRNRNMCVGYNFYLYRDVEDGRLMRLFFEITPNDLVKSPSFIRLRDYLDENKHLILHNDKEYGKSHRLTDVDFI